MFIDRNKCFSLSIACVFLFKVPFRFLNVKKIRYSVWLTSLRKNKSTKKKEKKNQKESESFQSIVNVDCIRCCYTLLSFFSPMKRHAISYAYERVIFTSFDSLPLYLFVLCFVFQFVYFIVLKFAVLLTRLLAAQQQTEREMYECELIFFLPIQHMVVAQCAHMYIHVGKCIHFMRVDYLQ